jgi:hypothetical protein
MDIDSYIDIDREEYLKDDESEKNQKKYWNEVFLC